MSHFNTLDLKTVELGGWTSAYEHPLFSQRTRAQSLAPTLAHLLPELCEPNSRALLLTTLLNTEQGI